MMRWLLQQNPRRGLMVVAVLVAALAVFRWVHVPLVARRTAARSQGRHVQAALAQGKKRLETEGSLEEKEWFLYSRAQVLKEQSPGRDALASLVWYLSQVETASGARVISLKVEDHSGLSEEGDEGGTADQPFAVTFLTLQVEGNFAQQVLFNQGLEKAKLPLHTRSVRLQQMDPPDDEMEPIRQYPILHGTYRMALHFKDDKPGPALEGPPKDAVPLDPFLPG